MDDFLEGEFLKGISNQIFFVLILIFLLTNLRVKVKR